MGWRTIYIEENDYLNLYLDNLKITNINEEEILIPIKDIDVLIIDNYKVVISSNLLSKCAEYNVNLIICNIEHMPICQSIPLNGNCLSSKIIKEQISWNDDLKDRLWQQIVYHKISNQIYILEKNKMSNDSIELMKNLLPTIERFDKSNREGLCARIYFHGLFGNDFIRFNDDVVNSGLNYGYIILRTIISKSLVSKGLNGNLGIFHKGETNAFNLADDFIEIFRPLIDDYVKNNIFGDSLFTRDHKLGLIRMLNIKIKVNDKYQTLSNAIDIYIDSIINYFQNKGAVIFPEIKDYVV